MNIRVNDPDWKSTNIMESPRKFNDCYFYYYSTCTKGDNCVFRHEPSALGCETMCPAWQQGKCLDKRCKLRHMELRKNRKQIPCYWENQPGGCRKKHCPFMHKNPDARTDGIAPSQPGPAIPMQNSGTEPLCVGEPQALPMVPPQHPPAPAPVPLLWQQQRQVVSLDSAILGVLPAGAGGELLTRRVLDGGYALPVDPLVVSFEDESDNESAPSSTPTKVVSPDEAQRAPRTKSQELLLLERIQAEAAAFYSYDPPPPPDTSTVRANLSVKYDHPSFDEIAGKTEQNPLERRKSLDFKVLSLDEIRAKQKTDTIIHTKPITVNLSRKRKLSTQETLTASGNKILKVVRSNSIIYRKMDHQNPTSTPVAQLKVVQKRHEETINRKRTLSEQSDLYEIQDDELIDNCYEFKRIKIDQQISKPKLIRNISISKENIESKDDSLSTSKITNDSDSEVQIVSVELRDDTNKEVSNISEADIIDVDSVNMGEPVAMVDLSKDIDSDSDISISDMDLGLIKSVPDVVASCRKNTNTYINTEELSLERYVNVDQYLH